MYSTKSNFSGPLLSDKKFFSELINLNLKDLEEIPSLIEKEDYKACRKVFAEFFRNFLEPEKYFTAKNTVWENKMGKNGSYTTADDNENIEAAEKACRHYMVSCSTPSDFGENKVDWYSNPTHNGYMEWPWQLSRHAELSSLASAYRITSNEKYAYACAELLDSWLKQAEAPEKMTPHGDTLSWRTIECGIRQGGCWPYMIHTFYKTEAFTDDLIVDICKSLYEHAERLFTVHGGNNWLLMEMNGLLHIAVIYSFFKDSKIWQDYAIETLNRELKRQVYPDGFQYELTTDYQHVAISNYSDVLKLITAYGIEPDKDIASYIEKMVEVYVHLAQPDKCVPDINDGMKYNAKEMVARYISMFPNNQLFKWVITDGKEGTAPSYNHIFENSGLAVLRTGHSENDTWVFFDGGEFGAGHQHEDKLNLLMYADGKLILTEAGKYAYDASRESKYTLSTRAHNTVRVDGLGQFRRKNYKWKDEINKKSDLYYKGGENIDVLKAEYNEGYGNKGAEAQANHKRTVLFVKKEKHLKPFLIVIDRLQGINEGELHTYGVMWHLDSESLLIDNLNLKADSLNLILPNGEFGLRDISLSVCRGQFFPEVQGLYMNSANQFDYRPIHCAEYKLTADKARLVTVFCPDVNGECPIEKVEASRNIDSTLITIRLANGETLVFDENSL